MDYPYTREAPADTTPAEVLERVFNALDAKRWADVVELLAPGELERFAAEQVAAVHKMESARSVVEMLAGRSSLAPDVLERHARAEEERGVERRKRIAELYEGRSTSAEIAELRPEALFLMWLAGSDPAAQIRRAAAQAEQEHPGLTSAALETILGFRRQILSTEYPRADVARVTYREWFTCSGADEVPDAAVRVATLRRTVTGWRIQVDAELMGHASLTAVVERTGE